MYNFNNAFADYFQKINNNNFFSNANNFGFDQQSITNAFKQGLEFWNETIQNCVNQAQQLIANNVDFIEKNNKELINSFDELSNTNNLEQAFSKQQQLVNKIMDNNMNYAKKAWNQVTEMANENIQNYNRKASSNQ